MNFKKGDKVRMLFAGKLRGTVADCSLSSFSGRQYILIIYDGLKDWSGADRGTFWSEACELIEESQEQGHSLTSVFK